MNGMYTYEEFKNIVWNIYNEHMTNSELDPVEVSMILKKELFKLLEEVMISNEDEFQIEIDKVCKRLLGLNQKYKLELYQNLPEKFIKNLTDLNSVVMGIPNNKDSDLDFTISVESLEEQKKVGEILESIGYNFIKIFEDNISGEIKWHDYRKYDGGTEIEVKVRWKLVVDRVLIAHYGIKNDLTEEQKLKISYIKSVLVSGDRTTYKIFKYIVYGAMFDGNEDAIIFRID